MVRMNSRIATAGKAAALMAAFLCIALLTFSCDSNIKDDLADDGTTDDGTAGSVPTAPGTLTVTPGSGQITVSWSAVSGAVSYDVYSHTGTDSALATVFENTTSTTSTVTGLTNGTQYYVWVKAKNSTGSSVFSPQGQGKPGLSFTESWTPGSGGASKTLIGKTLSTTFENIGLGQRIKYDQVYRPETFSVWIESIDSVSKFHTGSDTAALVSVILELRIWNASGILLGQASKAVSSGTTGEVVFTITGITEDIAANQVITYAVFISTAYTDNINGQLEMIYTDTYAVSIPEADLVTTGGSTTTLDANITTFNHYTTRDQDLRFSLTGRKF